jgi:hypothetical protein
LSCCCLPICITHTQHTHTHPNTHTHTRKHIYTQTRPHTYPNSHIHTRTTTLQTHTQKQRFPDNVLISVITHTPHPFSRRYPLDPIRPRLQHNDGPSLTHPHKYTITITARTHKHAHNESTNTHPETYPCTHTCCDQW